MMFNSIKKWSKRISHKENINRELYGIGLDAGDNQYRAYVGPPIDYDLVAAMTFNLLTTLGLRQHHKVLDIGCGSLRVGRILIPYLNIGNYAGVDPNKWLVKKGVEHEIGRDQIRIKKPYFYFNTSISMMPKNDVYDFVFAQSVFSHCGPNLVQNWLTEISTRLTDTGLFLATFLIGDDCQNGGWLYPECVTYTPRAMEKFGKTAGLNFTLLDWKHPRQVWALYTKQDINKIWFQNKAITWNNYLEQTLSEFTF